MKTTIKALVKKYYAVAIAVTVAFGLGLLLSENNTDATPIKTNEISVSANSNAINVSESDRNETRINAYKNNVTVKYNGEVVDLSNGTTEGNVYISNGYILSFSEKDGKIVASIRFGELSDATSFGINSHLLINDANGNTIYNSTSYGYMFDENGNKINNGYISNHEQDLDENGNVIGIQDETKVKMTESQRVSSKPSNGSAGTVEKKKNYSSANAGSSMGNVEGTVNEIASNPSSDYRQITIANANGNNDGTTINAVSTNGGSDMFTIYCVSRTGNTLNCRTSSGSNVTITISMDGSGAMTFSGINGIYR